MTKGDAGDERGGLAPAVALTAGALLMAWVTAAAVADFAAAPDVLGGLRLVIEAIALVVLVRLAVSQLRRLRPGSGRRRTRR